MMLALATVAAFAVQAVPAASQVQGRPFASDFDLASPADRAVSREDAAPSAPVAPRNLDTRDFAVDAPEIEMPLSENGPRLLVGAMGGKHKGMPKLAHIALGWNF